jgi:LuxR family maltose regulon positive regulatory protein
MANDGSRSCSGAIREVWSEGKKRMKQDSAAESQFSPLIYTKVHMPRSPDLLSRSRLLDFMHENIHRKLLLVCAGPGYGKTSLLVDFARSTDLPVCWYTLDATDRDPRAFLSYLVEAVRVRFPPFGERTRALLQQSEGSAGGLRAVMGVLVNELAQEIPDYLVIALDDYHTVHAEETLNQAVDTLLQYLPENVHLIVSGRTVPRLSLTRMLAYGEAAAVGTEHLRFTTEEGRQLLQQNFDLDLPVEEMRRLVEESEGWITGVLLKAQAIRQGGMEVLTRAQGPDDRVYAYLADEVVRHLSPPVRDFCRKASILGQMDAALCDALLQRQDSAQVLSFLEQHNLFLVPLEGDWYRFHDLFREFLLGEARLDWDEFVQLQRRAAQLWKEQGEPAAAVEHLLQARAYEDAAEEIEKQAQECYEHSRFQTLLRWIEALPEAAYRERPQLLLFQGKAAMAMGQGERARTSLLQAERLFAQRGNVRGWVQAIADRAFLERTQGAYQEALQTAREALARAPEPDSPAIVDLHRTIGRCLHVLGDLAGAEAHSRAAVERSLGTGMYSQAVAYLDLGFCLYAQGRLVEADAAYRQALERCQRVGSPVLMAHILNDLANVLFLRGEFQEAQDLLGQALEAAQTSLSLHLQALVWASLGDLYRDLGDLSRARQIYQEGLERARRAGDAAMVTYLLEALGHLARQEGALPEARRHLQGAMEAAASSPADRARVQISLALLELAEGRTAAALDLVEAASSRQEEAGWRLELPRTWLVRAIVQHRRRRGKEARAALQRAAALAEETGVVEPFLAEREVLLPLLRQLSPEARGGFLEEVLGRLRARPALREGPPPAEEARPALRILALGPGQVFWGDQEVSGRDWGYRLSRELFFYLLFHTPVRKEQVGLEFWPDRPAARVSSVFHRTLYQARRAVGGPFVVFHDDVYDWNPQTPYWCDVVEFKRLLEQAQRLSPDDPQAIAVLKEALALYRGDFLEKSDSDWCVLYREGLARQYLQALLLLGSLGLDQQALPEAQEAFRRALQSDGFCEEAYRGLMRCHLLAGERADAIRVYRQCRRCLWQELHVEPSEETQALYRAIGRGESLPPSP